MALPSGYRRLKCIRSTGTQHLDLGFQPNQDTRIVVDFQTLEVNGETHIASARSSGSTPLYTLFFGSTGKYGSRYGTSGTQYLANVTGIGRHVLDKNKNVTSADGGEAVTAASETFTVGSSLTVFARNDGTGVNGHISGELYSLQAYAAVVMIRDLIPALRISDSKPGAYDDVTGEFLTNAGTGEFEYEEITPTGDHRTMVDGVIWGIPSGRCLVDGVGYSIKKGRTLVDGVGYDVAFGMSAASLAVGSSVFANVNGVRTEFLVVHQGLPSDLYDASCDGTWLLMKDVYENLVWRSNGGNVYSNSAVYPYLNGDFLGLFDAGIQSLIKQVKIPWQQGGSGSVYSGSNGLSAQIFLLSGYEVGWTTSTSSKFPVDGACLDYFSGTETTDTKRIASRNAKSTTWWLRSPYKSYDGYVFYVTTTGTHGNGTSTSSRGIRPAFVIDSSAVVDPDTFDILG